MKTLLLDDFNSTFHPVYLIGTIMGNFGCSAFRNGWKIMYIYED